MTEAGMRKVILFNMVSLDGFFAGPDGNIDWHNVDNEFNEFALEQMETVSTLLFGRVTYELMASYWPTPAAAEDDPVVAERMNTMPKIVFSRTLARAEWQNTRLINENIAIEISKLKQQDGKDLIIFGSANLAGSLIQNGLIDEIRIMVNPIILGSGRSLFGGVSGRLGLKLLQTRAFHSGNVLLAYQPVLGG